MQRWFFWIAALVTLPALAVERSFDFSTAPVDQTPSGFRSLVAGRGQPGEWKVILDDAPPALAPLSSKAPAVARRAVLAQTSRVALNQHFPILLNDGEAYGDFHLSTRFKIVGGALEQMAGVVFHFQDETNFFAILADAQRNHFRCYKVVNGVATAPLGPDSLTVLPGVWHELSVVCEGARITAALDGQESIKLIDNASAAQPGKVGFFTKSDTVCYFTDARLSFTRPQAAAQALIKSLLTAYPRLADLAIYAVRPGTQMPVIIAAKNQQQIGQSGTAVEQSVITASKRYYAKLRNTALVTVPLRDRNGETIGAVRVEMNSFRGQTEGNALMRAKPILDRMQEQITSLEDLLH